jgi:hypothetical protein
LKKKESAGIKEIKENTQMANMGPKAVKNPGQLILNRFLTYVQLIRNFPGTQVL